MITYSNGAMLLKVVWLEGAERRVQEEAGFWESSSISAAMHSAAYLDRLKHGDRVTCMFHQTLNIKGITKLM